ncbi:hypothetical protein VNO78_12391 [Psophocarpus tetragonolobus]|uniref:Uncharacterized protein n=1 Tax=Psophocarpus tetragonolobus TaxID=3891 RepID=A0AAN9XPE1_PSOTE
MHAHCVHALRRPKHGSPNFYVTFVYGHPTTAATSLLYEEMSLYDLGFEDPQFTWEETGVKEMIDQKP